MMADVHLSVHMLRFKSECGREYVHGWELGQTQLLAARHSCALIADVICNTHFPRESTSPNPYPKLAMQWSGYASGYP